MGLKIKLKIPQDNKASGSPSSSARSPPRPPPPPPPPPPPLPPPPPRPRLRGADGDKDERGAEEYDPEKYDHEYVQSIWRRQEAEEKQLQQQEEEEKEEFFSVYIPRQSCKPLSFQRYMKLRSKWPQLLQGKSTYLRPRKERIRTYKRKKKLEKDKNVFRVPKAKEPPLGRLETLLSLEDDCASTDYIQHQKIKLLSEKYAFLRRVRDDGNCFYRSLFFAYMENLVKMQDGAQVEVTHLMNRVEKLKKVFLDFEGDEERFSHAIPEFKTLIDLISRGLAPSEDLYRWSLQEDVSSRSEDMSILAGNFFFLPLCCLFMQYIHVWCHAVLCFLRLLTEIEIYKRKDFYETYLQNAGYATAPDQYCEDNVRPKDTPAGALATVALLNALGVRLHVLYLDSFMLSPTVQLTFRDFIPEEDSEASPASAPREPGSLPSVRILQPDTSTSLEPLEQPSDSGSAARTPDRRMLVSLLYREGHYDILYPK